MDNRSFLTAKTGFVDVCLDQDFPAREILPIYAGVQMGHAPIPPLKTVPKEIALAQKCPMPDWNYLRWDGYSDEKYQAIRSGKGLLELLWQGETVSLELQVRSYYSGGNLALLLVDWSSGEPEEWGDLTVNLGPRLQKDCAFVDVNNLGQEILPWVEKDVLGKPTGRVAQSGFVTYPEYQFQADRLKALDANGYHSYCQLRGQNSQEKPQKKKTVEER